MKKKYWLLLLLALTMLFALSATAFAAGQVFVYFTNDTVPLSVDEETTVKAMVQNAQSNAIYTWTSSDESVVRLEGKKDTVKVIAVGDGYAKVTLNVTNSDGNSDYDFFKVAVDRSIPPVIVRGGDFVSMLQGDPEQLSATVTGGSGNYSFDWSASGSASLNFDQKYRSSATVSAGRPGKGEVILTVYDLEDLTNNDTVVWDLNVSAKQQATPPEIQLNRGSVDLGAGSTATLMISVEGGSGSYDYFWRSDNSSVVAIYGNSEKATLTATDTLLPGANTAQISVYVRDMVTGLTSNTATCVVAVSGGEASLDVRSSTIVGTSLNADNLADVISEGYRRNFGSNISLSASVMLENAASLAGSFRLQDGTMVRSGTSYIFAVFEDMVFQPSSAGTFSTGYRVVDGGNTISGTIQITVTGGIPLSNAYLDKATIDMTPYSNQYLTLNATPLNASYTVSWSVTDSRVITVGGSGNRVTLVSSGTLGKTTVIATVVDGLGNQYVRSCEVNVFQEQPALNEVKYDASLTIMLGSDYYGTKLSEAMTSSFKSAFGYYPASTDDLFFHSLGNARFGTLLARDGTEVVKGRSYTFLDWIDMYFAPHAAGTYQLSYQLSHGKDVLYGTINIIIESSSLNVTLSPTTLQMAPYSSQYVSLSVTPLSAYYRVSWASSDTNIVKVTGSNASAVLNSVGSGTATVYAIVTDARGIETRRGCTVVVSAPVSTFNPSVSTTLGIPYVGTGTSSAMRSQFASVYGVTLQDNAIIRFSSTGNNVVGIMRLADGTPIKANTDYTLAQYVGMYTQPVSAGTFSVPYTLSYAGKALSGTVSVVIKAASVSTNLTLSSRSSYWFSDPINGSTGSAILSSGIRNAAGANWSYIRFGSTSNSYGTLYADRSFTALKSTTNVTSSVMSQLYFVPGNQNGTFSVPYTVYTSSGSVIADGTLSIVIPGGTFTDVPTGAYYAQAVSWAVSKAVTSGTSDTTFSPDRTVTRGQAVTFLWRAAGQPKAVSAVNPFTDVKSGAYYYDAVLWAVQQGITSGTSDTTFSPESTLNRDQLLTFLCRASGGYAGGSDWSKLAVDWANSHGLLSGVPGTFVAKSACPRCDVVYYLWKTYNG